MQTDSRGLVFVADDDDAVRRSQMMLLEGAGYATQGYSSGETLLAALEHHPVRGPVCAVVDVRMGEGLNGLDVQRAIAARPGIYLPVILVTGHADVPLAVAAMRAGVANFLEKPYPPNELLDAVAEVMAAPQLKASRALPSLTPRERDVLTALVAGNSNKQIARTFGISPRTVEVHRASLMTRLGARNLAEAIRMALAAGLVKPAD